MKLLMLKGLPASGKSTYAKELIKQGNWVRINNDELAMMFTNGKRNKLTNRMLNYSRAFIIRHALKNGNNVVIDNTNLHPKHEINYKSIAKKFKAEFEIKEFPIDVETAIKRDLARLNSVGSRVIKQMYKQFIEKQEEAPEYNFNLPVAIICDIDGTLAHMVNRGPYDWKRVGEDVVDETIKKVLEMYNAYVNIFIVTGRDGSCLDDTKNWLYKNDVPYDKIFIRPEGNTENDTIIKERIYEEHIKGKYNVLFVIDDRDRVVEMWRRKGLKCLQVADGDF